MVEVEPENMQLNVPNSQKWAFLWETTNFSKGTIMILLLLHVLVCWFTHRSVGLHLSKFAIQYNAVDTLALFELLTVSGGIFVRHGN